MSHSASEKRWTYIAVTTGRDGFESPRLVPRTLAPELKYPQNGNAIYVFAQPERH